MERAIVHSDINHCYAQIEEMLNPELKQRPMAVGGSQEERHGIILAKNLHAKKYKIQTGETLDEARIKCPQLLILPPDYRRYQRITDQVKAIYREYTDRVEEYGLDEAWLDLTQSQRLFGPASQIARTIQQRVYAELGLTISIGLSFNKIFAKMASDFVKPSGFVTITRANFQEKIYPLSVRELFYVGAATQKKLEAWGITTIGDLASRDRQFMRRYFGKVGEMLHWFALGEDISEVALASEAIPVKSVGNSVTAVHDLHTHGEARLVLRVLAESVASRLRDQGLKGKGIALSLRDIHLFRWSCSASAPGRPSWRKKFWRTRKFFCARPGRTRCRCAASGSAYLSYVPGSDRGTAGFVRRRAAPSVVIAAGKDGRRDPPPVWL